MSKNVKKVKSEIPAIDKPIKKSKDRRCGVDKLLGIDKPVTKHQGAIGRNQMEAQRTFQLIIKQNHSILEYFKKEQEIDEIKLQIEALETQAIPYISEDENDSDEETLTFGEFTENGTQINEE